MSEAPKTRPLDSSRALLILIVANIVTSILHYVDNVMNFEHYPEPTWLNPHLVDLAWFVMTPIGIAGYFLFVSGRRKSALACLSAYGVMGLLVLGHYLIAPPWMLSLKINLFILAEAVAALLLMGFLLIRRPFRTDSG